MNPVFPRGQQLAYLPFQKLNLVSSRSSFDCDEFVFAGNYGYQSLVTR